jgi:tetratricopeptide (TPR) repeat protein
MAFFRCLSLLEFLQETLKITFVIVFILITIQGFCQTSGGRENVTKKAKQVSSSTPMELVNEANKRSETDAAKSMELATTALERSLSQKDKKGEYYSYNTLGTLYYNIGNWAKAVQYFTLARNGFTSIKDEKGKSYSEKYLALALEKQKNYGEALKVTSSAPSRVSSKEEEVRSKYNKARLKSKAGKDKEAISELKSLARDTTLSIENKIQIYKELGDLYVASNDTASAFKAYDEVLQVENEGTYQLNLSKTGKVGYFDVLKKVSDLNIKSGNEADNFLLQNTILAQGLKSKDPDLVQAANLNIGTTLMSQDQEIKAIPFLFTSASIARSRSNPVEEQKSVKELAQAYENLGQYDKALDVYKRYVQLSDSFKILQAGSEEAALALNAEFLKQEDRIRGLMDSQKEKEVSIKRQRNILWTLGGGLMLFVLLTWALVRNIRQKQKANMLIKLQSLRTQMNPHFIFNSLNSVNNFIAKNDERSANRYLSEFSKLMRTVLKNSDQDFVSLASEIQTLGIYLELEHFRFGDKFEYRLEVAPEVEPEAVQIPSMLIQPYIENAIWHGLRYKEEKGVLEVKFFIEGKKLYCSIFDNGIGRRKSAELKTDHQKIYQSTGIKNTKERIEILNKLHGTSLGITIQDIEEGEEKGTLVKISLPYIMEEIVV